jgi:fucose permease
LWEHFSIAAVILVAATCYFAMRWYVDDREPTSEHHQTEKATSLLRDRRLLTIGLVVLAAVFLEGAAADWLGLFLHDVRDTSQSVAALGYATFALAMALIRIVGTPLIARVGRATASRTAGVIALAGVVIVLAIPSVVTALLGILMWGIGTGLVYPAGMSASGETPGRAAEAIALVSLIGYSGFLLSPPLVGLIAQYTGLQTALWAVVPGALAIAVFAPIVGHRPASNPIPESA